MCITNQKKTLEERYAFASNIPLGKFKITLQKSGKLYAQGLKKDLPRAFNSIGRFGTGEGTGSGEDAGWGDSFSAEDLQEMQEWRQRIVDIRNRSLSYQHC